MQTHKQHNRRRASPKRGRQHSYPIWGTTLIIIAAVAALFMVIGIRSFIAFKNDMEAAGELDSLLTAIIVFASVGAAALGYAVIGGIVFLITFPVGLYLMNKGL